MSPSDLFLRPEALPVLLLAPLVWFVLRALDRARARRLERLVGPRVSVLAAERSTRRRSVRRAVFCLALLLALVAASGPTFGEPVHDVEWRGIDIVVGLDMSRSMLARDLPPDRLAYAKREIRALAEHVEGDRLGLVVFAGDARLEIPLTQDMATFTTLTDLADPSAVLRGGTDLGAALEAMLETLEGRSGEHGLAVLLTDGEDLSRRGIHVAEACRRREVTVHCLGLGTTLGSKITLEREYGESFLKDRSGADVVSAMDAAGLRRIAEATGGTYADAGARSQPLVGLYEEHILPMARTSFESEERRRRRNHFQWPLSIALALWMLGPWLRERTRR